MATLGETKQRIITESNRDDLSDDLSTQLDLTIRKAISDYEQQRWWFNEVRTQAFTTAGSQYTNYPADFVFLDRLFLVVGNVRYDLTPRSVEWIEGMYSTPQTGQPTDYCSLLGQVRWWPTPPIVYETVWIGVTRVSPALVDDSSSNYWTNEGQDLIVARTLKTLYRDVFNDPRVANAQAAEDEAYNELKGWSNRRMSTGRVANSFSWRGV